MKGAGWPVLVAYLALICTACSSYKTLSPLVLTDSTNKAYPQVPRLILIAGATGTGKSSLGMALAHANSFKKCVSTDTIREVARCYSDVPEVHRPSYGGEQNPTADWMRSVRALRRPVESILDHTLSRRKSMILEGVALEPINAYIEKWRSLGGAALGVLVKVRDENKHMALLRRRGYDKQVSNFERIREVQEEMCRLASAADWLQLEQADTADMIHTINSHFKKEEVRTRGGG